MPPHNRVVTNKKIDMKSLRRLIAYVYRLFSFRLFIVAICIIISAVSNVIVNAFMADLIDKIILPGMNNGLQSVYKDLVRIITIMIVFDVLGLYRRPSIRRSWQESARERSNR